MVVLLGALPGCGLSANVSPEREAARQAVAEGALLVDVRTPEEFASGHLREAVNLPVQELHRRTSELGAKDRQVVVYCRSGARSRRAAELLRAEGFLRVVDLGPMSAW